MAMLNFKMGLMKNLSKQSKVAGTVYVTTDERAMYIDISETERIRLGDFRIYDNLKALANDKEHWSEFALVYCSEENALARFNGTEWVLINDTSEIVASISNLNTAIETLEGRVTTAEGKITTAEGKITTLEGEMDAVEGRATTLEGKVSTLEGDMDAVEGRMTTAEGQIQNLSTQLGTGSVSTQINNAIAGLDADKTSAAVEAGKGLQVQVVEVDGKITAVNVTGSFDNKYDAKGAAADAKSAVEGQLNTAKQDLQTLINGVKTTLEGKDNELTSSIDTINDRLDGLGSAKGDVKKYIDEQKGNAITAANDYTDDEIEKVKTTASGQATKIENIESSIATLQAKDTELSGKITANTNKFGELGDATVKSYVDTAKQAAIDAAATTAQSKVDELANGQVTTNKTNIEGLTTKVGNLEAADIALDGRLDIVEGQLNGLEKTTVQASIDKAEADAAETAQSKVNAAVKSLKEVELAAINTNAENLLTALNQEVTDRKAADKALEDAYKLADTGLQDNIDEVDAKFGELNGKTVKEYVDAAVGSLDGDVATTIQNLSTALETEAKTREDADKALSERITANADKFGALGDQTVKAYVDAAKDSAISTASGALATAKTELNGAIQNLSTALDKEKQDRANGDATNKNLIDALTTRVTKNEGHLAGIADGAKVTDLIATAKSEAISSAAATAQSKVDALANGRVTNLETAQGQLNTLANSNKDRLDAIVAGATVDTFAEVEALITSSIKASDAMVFKGVLDEEHPLPTTNLVIGDTYKVGDGGTYAGHTCITGDLLIWDGSAWAYVPSGNETFIDPTLSSTGAVINLTSGMGAGAKGSVTIEGKSGSQVKVEGNGANKIAISIEWGKFE